MLGWEMNLPDEHGISPEAYEKYADQEIELDVELSEPELLPRNDRAYRALRRYLSIAERDSHTHRLHLDYQALRDIMVERGCTACDRERVLDAWSALRSRDAEYQQSRSDAAEEKKSR